ncbi:MAG: chromosomal replication initiator protein DnaA [Mariprofundaceae bacterium]|nr:chromosomal replication initiator protein DnaA [Mariprofundaceae bacterium]
MEKHWLQVMNHLKTSLDHTKYDAWIEPVRVSFEGRELHITAPGRFFLDGLKRDCGTALRTAVDVVLGQSITIHYAVDDSIQAHAAAEAKRVKTVVTNTGKVDGNIDSRFTFANFVVGSSNEFVFAACQAVAEKPSQNYNPLYVHGGVGLGKTHLIHAIANTLIKANQYAIAYRTGERFTNELIEAIRTRTTQDFRERYRKVDVLIIDDVQFIEGKTSTQEEFFHTFNALHEVQKQIILVSDRSPHNMAHLEERLRSRFNWGLVADIQPPNLETRLAILHNKAELAGITLESDVAYLLGSRISNNVRELEGALTRLNAYAHLTHKEISIDMAKHVLREQLRVVERIVDVDDIQKKVADYYAIQLKEMKSPRRSRNVAFPRQVAMFLCKELTRKSLPGIGEAFGGRDHTTILYACRKIDNMRKSDAEFNDEIERLMKAIQPDSI